MHAVVEHDEPSALQWAWDGTSQDREEEGDQSWLRIRDVYLEALTALTETERKAGFEEMFKGLGHQMHLVQDIAVPAHARNDSHPLEAYFKSDACQGNKSGLKRPLYSKPKA